MRSTANLMAGVENIGLLPRSNRDQQKLRRILPRRTLLAALWEPCDVLAGLTQGAQLTAIMERYRLRKRIRPTHAVHVGAIDRLRISFVRAPRHMLRLP